MSKRMLIDPPSGWRYGFPRPYDNPDNMHLEDWLISKGYPKHEIEACGDYFYVRWIETDVTDSEEEGE